MGIKYQILFLHRRGLDSYYAFYDKIWMSHYFSSLKITRTYIRQLRLARIYLIGVNNFQLYVLVNAGLV